MCAEKTVGGKWSLGMYVSPLRTFNCRLNDLNLFPPEQTVFTGMRVEAQDGNSWFWDQEIVPEYLMNVCKFFY